MSTTGTVKRNDKLAFYGIKDAEGTVTYNRMKGFTDMTGEESHRVYKTLCGRTL